MGDTGDKRKGTFLGVPYDMRPPTPSRVKERFWNPDEDRVLVPAIFGWGWAINWHALLRRLGVIRTGRPRR